MPIRSSGYSASRGPHKDAYSDLRRYEVKNPALQPRALPLDKINPVSQVREHIEQGALEELVSSIAKDGQQSPGAVAAVPVGEIDEYLRVINTLWLSSIVRQNLKSTRLGGKAYYLIVIYGHRRLAALRQLARTRGGAWHYLTTVHFDLTIAEVVRKQLAENLYVPPAQHREIQALSRLWNFEKALATREGRKLTLTEFAKKMGRTPGYMRNLLRFTTLPQALQDRINPASGQTLMAYSLLLELERLVAAYRRHGRTITDADMVLMADSLMLRRVKTRDYAKEVSLRIAELEGGQHDLFAGDGIAPNQRQNRQVAAQGLVLVMQRSIEYWHIVMRLWRCGAFDQPPLGAASHAPHSPANMAVRVVNMLELTLPPLESIIATERRKVRHLGAATKGLSPLAEAFELVVAAEAGGIIIDEAQGGLL